MSLAKNIHRKVIKRNLSKDQKLQNICIFFMIFCLIIGIVLPLSQLFTKAFKDNDGQYAGLYNFIKYFSSPHLFSSINNTFFISSYTTIVSVTLGFFYAYALSRTNMKFKKVLKYIAILPLFAPTMMHGIALRYLFGNKGLITTGFFGTLGEGVNINLYGPVGIIISEIIYTFPQAFLILSIGLEVVDYRLYEAAETLGTSKIRQFFTVTIPNVKYALLSSCIVCFSMSFTDFGAPKVVGGNYNVLATDVFKQVVGQQNMTMGAVVGIILLVPAIISFLLDRVVEKKQSGIINAKSKSYRVKRNRLRDGLFLSYCTFIALFILSLLGAVVLAASVKGWPYDLSFTLDHFLFKNMTAYSIKSYYNSIKLSILSAIIGTLVIFFSAYLIEKTRYLKKLRQVAYFLSILPLAVPGLVIGISYIFFFNSPHFTIPLINIEVPNPFNLIYGTVFILILANIIHFYSVPFITANTALKKLDKEFEMVSESMSIPFYRTFADVTLPMSVTAIAEIFIYLFVNSMVTVSAVIFLYSSKFKVASIAIVNMEDAGDIAAAAAMAVLIVVTNLVIRLLYERFNKKLTKRLFLAKQFNSHALW